jgi:Protein of unknown function (DUF3592)
MKTAANLTAKSGKGCATLFFGVFVVMGMVFFLFLGKLTWDTAREYSWEETDCTILTSRLDTTGKKYALAISYRYEFGRREFTGTRFRTSGNEFDKAIDAQRMARKYAGDTRAKCFVNPRAPEQSVIERGSLWFAAALLFPLIFVAIGIAGIAGVRRSALARAMPVSERARKAGATGTLVLRILGVVFTVVGGLVLYFITIRTVLEIRAAAGWAETPCVITSGSIESHRGSKGVTTYSLNIRFRYEVDGREYLGDRYNFSDSSSSNRKWREEVLRKHPPGSRTVCFVNPDDPLEAVLNRDSGGTEWFGFIPGVFIVIGLAMFFGAGRSARSRRPFAATGADLRASSPGKLKAASTPLAGCVGIGIFAAIWNGVVWGIFLGANLPTGAKVVLALFALVGLGMIAAALHQFLALFNPKPELTARAGAVPLGGTVEVDFRLSGSVKRISRLRVTLEGTESATYRRGTNTVTDKSVFARVLLLDTGDPMQMSSGTLRAVVPADLMHTFDAPNNKITWTLRVRGEIPKWPDVDAEYPLTVSPAGSGGG